MSSPSNSTSFAPDEPPHVLNMERGVLAGIGLGLAAWGVLLTLAVQCVSALSKNLRGKPGHRYFLAYVCIMFSLGTVAIFTHLKWVQTFLIDNRNFPGGPLAYDTKFYANDINVTGVVCYFIMNWFADGLLLYRLFIIWERKLLIVAFPLLMFLTSFSLSVVDLITLSQPGNSMFTDSAVNFGLLYWSFSISLTVVVTCLIVGRLLFMRRRIAAIAGERHARVYLGISSMLIESAALYSLSAIVFLVGYSLQDPLQFAAEPVEVIQGIAPLMIILRVANGNAFSDRTFTSGTTAASTDATRSTRTPVMRFATHSETNKSTTESSAQYAMGPVHRVSLLQSPTSTTGTAKIRFDEESYPGIVGEAK